jgi:Zn finger protein HypA/HybF involved in hydrogenase expression
MVKGGNKLKCPKCNTTKIDLEAENQMGSVVVRAYCMQCDYAAVAVIDSSEFEEE